MIVIRPLRSQKSHIHIYFLRHKFRQHLGFHSEFVSGPPQCLLTKMREKGRMSMWNVVTTEMAPPILPFGDRDIPLFVFFFADDGAKRETMKRKKGMRKKKRRKKQKRKKEKKRKTKELQRDYMSQTFEEEKR